MKRRLLILFVAAVVIVLPLTIEVCLGETAHGTRIETWAPADGWHGIPEPPYWYDGLDSVLIRWKLVTRKMWERTDPSLPLVLTQVDTLSYTADTTWYDD